MNFEERELYKFLEKYYNKEIKKENYKYFGETKFVLLPIDLLNENFGFSAYKLRNKFKNISEEMPFQTRLGQGRKKYFAFIEKKPTNFQKIKQMSVEEIALLLNCECCIYNDGDPDCDGIDCQNAVEEWLLQECE